MANRYFNKQTTNARQALAQGGPAKLGPRTDPRKRTGGPRKGRPSLGEDAAPRRKGRPSIPEFPKQPRQPNPGPKSLPPKKLKPFDNTDRTPKPPTFDNTDRTDREKIIRDRIMRNKMKDKLDKLKQKMKVGPVGTGLNPDKLKKSIKNLKDQMGGKKPESPERKKRQADYMKKHGKNAPRRKTLSTTKSYKKEVEGLK